ncbi:hypothetical protein TIFTF001_009956 [Ficus carica]|uniref:Uncharacterized protein n=1 Tax=Ficus carica TaxID=3494 RepID=A0AA87ZUM2_FICCA|nr:hypothetical protein TIFTF001_009956 [Ficus carica]
MGARFTEGRISKKRKNKGRARFDPRGEMLAEVRKRTRSRHQRDGERELSPAVAAQGAPKVKTDSRRFV